jgi:hypothetical protein
MQLRGGPRDPTLFGHRLEDLQRGQIQVSHNLSRFEKVAFSIIHFPGCAGQPRLVRL